MTQASKFARYQRFASNPWTVIVCVLVGGMLGWAFPALSKSMSIVGLIYIGLLKMIVIPLMVSAVVFSLQKLFRDGGAGKILGRVMLVFVAFSFVAAFTSALGTLVMRPGTNISASTRTALGNIVGGGVDTNTDMALRAIEVPKVLNTHDVIEALIPTNIFASMANGETLKVLVFALIFGLAVGHSPTRFSEGLGNLLESIFNACQMLTRGVNLPIPLVLICITANQIAETGLEPIISMFGFVIAFLVISFVLLALAIAVISWRSGCRFAVALDAMRETFTIGVATNNSSACMPVMIDGMAERLHYLRSNVELVIPLSVSLLRAGAIAYFVCGTIFIAAIYDHQLTTMEIGTVILVSVLSGFASTGMAGILTISLIGTTCNYLGLPFEAAFILFVAVDPVCAMARTAVTVIGGCAAVAMVCARPEPGVSDA